MFCLMYINIETKTRIIRYPLQKVKGENGFSSKFNRDVKV